MHVNIFYISINTSVTSFHNINLLCIYTCKHTKGMTGSIMPFCLFLWFFAVFFCFTFIGMFSMHLPVFWFFWFWIQDRYRRDLCPILDGNDTDTLSSSAIDRHLCKEIRIIIPLSVMIMQSSFPALHACRQDFRSFRSH
jgi:hypothetical protein